MNNLTNGLSAMADEMTDTDYTALRNRVGATSRRLGHRRAVGTSLAALAVIGAASIGGLQLAPRAHQSPIPAGTPSAQGTLDGTPSPQATATPLVKEADVYVQVLRRYLSTDSSFPDQTFKTIYVLDQAHPDAGDPDGKHERGAPIAPNAQQHITAALAGVAHVAFIADRGTVIETKDGCAQVRDGGILITLGPANGDDHEVQVAINGFVNCLGAMWLTYVVQNEPGTGWRVTGTTGSMTIS
jgi:hypothetical protein